MEKASSITVLCLLMVLLTFEDVSGSCKGCVELDSLSFDKVVNNFKYSIIKLDQMYPYGPKHEEYESFAKDAASQNDLAVGIVGVKDYGEKDNQDLADRFGFAYKDLPKIVLLRKNDLENPIVFTDEEFTSDSYRRFVRQNTDLYLGLAGCIQALDEMAANFVGLSAEEQKKILENADKLVKPYEGGKDEQMAKVYLSFMSRLADRGATFVDAEKQRLKKILNGSLSDAKKDDLRRRMNVLESFVTPESKGIKTEL